MDLAWAFATLLQYYRWVFREKPVLRARDLPSSIGTSVQESQRALGRPLPLAAQRKLSPSQAANGLKLLRIVLNLGVANITSRHLDGLKMMQALKREVHISLCLRRHCELQDVCRHDLLLAMHMQPR